MVSGLTEVHVLCASAQTEFSKRQSDGQEIDLLRWDACERCQQAGKEALPQVSEDLVGYSFISKGSGGGKRPPLSPSSVVAAPWYLVREYLTP